ncbi:MAG: GNAT family N-acetyltransferase [Candidatus Levybacteria bacterium]|nr:GNAT family N-acetyltransferase [Candidatus Levybacteria bacterium]
MVGSKEGLVRGASQERRTIIGKEKLGHVEGVKVDNLDLSNARQLGEALAILKDPSNADHLADISQRTSLKDILDYYSDKRRIARIALDKEGQVVGMYDIFGIPPSDVANLSPEERSGVSIASAMLSRLCVKPNQREKGIGSSLIEDGERQAFFENNFPILRGAIVLSKEQMEFYQEICLTTDRTKINQALAEKGIELHSWRRGEYDALEGNEALTDEQRGRRYRTYGEELFTDWFVLTDPRGKAFIKNRGWKFRVVYTEQTRVNSTEKVHPVLIVEKLKAEWEKEQIEKEPQKSHRKVIDVEKKVPKGGRRPLPKN